MTVKGVKAEINGLYLNLFGAAQYAILNTMMMAKMIRMRIEA